MKKKVYCSHCMLKHQFCFVFFATFTKCMTFKWCFSFFSIVTKLQHVPEYSQWLPQTQILTLHTPCIIFWIQGTTNTNWKAGNVLQVHSPKPRMEVIVATFLRIQFFFTWYSFLENAKTCFFEVYVKFCIKTLFMVQSQPGLTRFKISLLLLWS